MSSDQPGTAERTLRVLERLAAPGPHPTHAELAFELGIAKSTLTVLLTTLQQLGYVERVDRRYRPGAQLLALGYHLAPHAENELALRRRLRPALETVAARTGETAVLSIEIGAGGDRPGMVLAIDHVESEHPLRFVPATIGRPQPMYRTAAGRVFLAFSGRSATMLPPESLVPMTEKTLVDPQAIDRELQAVRERGYAINADETYTGVVTLAAPVLDAGIGPVAAISVFGPTMRHTHPDKTIWPHVREALGSEVLT
jgi:DNA-binding IclR family transcriptional regulator